MIQEQVFYQTLTNLDYIDFFFCFDIVVVSMVVLFSLSLSFLEAVLNFLFTTEKLFNIMHANIFTLVGVYILEAGVG